MIKSPLIAPVKQTLSSSDDGVDSLLVESPTLPIHKSVCASALPN